MCFKLASTDFFFACASLSMHFHLVDLGISTQHFLFYVICYSLIFSLSVIEETFKAGIMN